MSEFMPGLKLSELFYRECVEPILRRHWPDLGYAAGRLDFGSDVLGFDTPQSRDHDWGPRCMLFVRQDEPAGRREEIARVLGEELPFACGGYPTNWTPDNDFQLQPTDIRPIRHRVTTTTVPEFFGEYTGIDPTQPIAERAWLLVPPQRLRTITSGRVFHDGLGQLEPARRALAWYPHDVWLYLMANQWQRISQEEPFMARCGDVGDDLGSRVVAARLANEVMRLCFLIERQYAPYYKWFGTAFARLACAAELTPLLTAALSSGTWKEREACLSQAYRVVMRMHNDLGRTPAIEPKVWGFHKRPYQVPHAERFVEALHAAIQSQEVRSWPAHVGAVWQFADSTDVLDSIGRCRRLGSIYNNQAAT